MSDEYCRSARRGNGARLRLVRLDCSGLVEAQTLKRVTFSIGLSDSSGSPIPLDTRSRLCSQTYSYLVSKFGGYTVTEVSGGWKGAGGKEYREDGLDIWVNTDKTWGVDAAAEWLAETWDQEAVMVTIEDLVAMRYVGRQRSIAA